MLDSDLVVYVCHLRSSSAKFNPISAGKNCEFFTKFLHYKGKL